MTCSSRIMIHNVEISAIEHHFPKKEGLTCSKEKKKFYFFL